MMSLIRPSTAFLIMILSSAKASPPPEDFDRAFTEAYSAFAKGVDGDEGSVVRSIEAFEKLFEAYPYRWEAYAFYGSACTLRARDVALVKKMDYVRKGFGAMDEAVRQAPNCYWTRLVRAINSYQVPGFFQRRNLAREDFDFLTREIPSSDPDVPLAETLLQLTYFHAGRFAYEERDPRALHWLNEAAAIEEGPIPGSELDQALQRARKRFGS